MPILQSAVASVALAETVRVIREKKTEEHLDDVIDDATEKTAMEIQDSSDKIIGIDSANIFSIIDTADVETLIESNIEQGRKIDDEELLEAVNCDILDNSVDCETVLSQFVKSLELEMVKHDVLGEILKYSYFTRILDHTDEILSNQEELREILLSELGSESVDFDVISDLNIPKLIDAQIANAGVTVRAATQPGLLTDERILESAIENSRGILTMDLDFLSDKEPYGRIDRSEIAQIDIPSSWSHVLPEGSSLLLVGAQKTTEQKIKRAISSRDR